MTKKKFLNAIEKVIQQGWKNNPKGCKTNKEALIWTSCYLQAEELHETMTLKDWAEFLRNGFTAVDTRTEALRYWNDIYDNWDYDGVIERVKDFWK
jgi:hypothetical protein